MVDLIGKAAITTPQDSNTSQITANAARQNPPAQTGNVATTRTSSPDVTIRLDQVDSISGLLNDINTFQTNILNAFDNPTYHFRLFMTGNRDLFGRNLVNSTTSLSEALSKLKTVTIAESGVTAFNIRDVQMESVVGPNMQTRNANATKIVITVVEPMGTSLLDRILAAATQELAILNYAKMFYYLELRFKGYETDGTINNNICSGFGNGGVWVWQIFIKDIEVNSEAGGTTYTITAMPHNENALEDELLRLPDNILATSNTVKGSLDAVFHSLNASIKARYGGYQLYEYEVVLHDVQTRLGAFRPDDFGLISDPKIDNKRTYQYSSFTGGDSSIITGHFQRGMTITDLIETVYAHSKLGQQLAKEVLEVDVLEPAKGIDKFRECCVFRVEPVIEVGDFDGVTRLYQKKITFHVWGYSSQLPIMTGSQIEKAETKDAQVAMVQRLKKGGFLIKRFDYLFTGLNTEVLKFDGRFNLSWSAVLPKFTGQFNSYDQLPDVGQKRVETIARATDLQMELKTVTKLAQGKQAQLAILTEAKNTGHELTDAELKAAGFTTKITLDAEIASLSNQLNNPKTGLLATIGDLTANLVPLRQQINDNIRAAEQKAGLVSAQPIAPKFAEELAFATTPAELTVPISLFEDNSDPRNQVTGPLTGSNHRDVSIYGAILDQLYGPMTKQLINISMEVRGDPYWIGPSNLDRRFMLEQSSSPTVSTQVKQAAGLLPDYQSGDNCFLLTYRYPLGLDEETDAPILGGNGSTGQFKQQEQFTGIYAMRKITHSFSNGLFTQTLDALRMPLINVLETFGIKLANPNFVPAGRSTRRDQG